MNAGERNRELHDSVTQNTEGHPDDAQTGSKSSPMNKKPPAERRTKRAPSREPASEVQARQRAIGQELQRMFNDITNEPVPAEMLDLLHRIGKQHSD
jgi:Anti-sigma factor NepR